MRTSISIPDKYYNYIKLILNKTGFVTLNDFILSLLREKLPISYGAIEEKYKKSGSNQIGIPILMSEEMLVTEKIPEKVILKQDVAKDLQSIRYILDNCQMPDCAKRAVGLFKVIVVIEGQESTKELLLCTTHFQNAQQSGEEPEKIK